MVQTGAILVEAVDGDGTQPNQPVSGVVDNAAEQEAQLITSGLVGIGGHLKEDRPTEDALVEAPGPNDVGDGEPDVRDGGSGDGHSLIVPARRSTRRRRLSAHFI